MATWSKLKQQMESFLAESLQGRVEYTYRVATAIPKISQGNAI